MRDTVGLRLESDGRTTETSLADAVHLPFTFSQSTYAVRDSLEYGLRDSHPPNSGQVHTLDSG